MPKVSIITPCFNAERFVGLTMDSLRAQTFTDWEHIIVDDGSRDNSAAVVQKYADADSRFKMLRQANGGMCNARNNGFAACAPDSHYLLFLDADDCLLPSMLAVMVDYLDNALGVGLAYCDRAYIDSDGRPADPDAFGYGIIPRFAPQGRGVRELPADVPETPFAAVWSLANINPSMSVLRRSVYEQTPRWDEAFGQGAEDTDLFLHVALRSAIHFVPQALVQYRLHHSQASTNKDHIRDKQQKLFEKWLAEENVTVEQKALVREAWHFREGRLMPRLWFSWAREHLRKGKLVLGLRTFLIGLKQIIRYRSRILRGVG